MLKNATLKWFCLVEINFRGIVSSGRYSDAKYRADFIGIVQLE